MAKQELNIEIRNSKQIQMIEKQKIQNRAVRIWDLSLRVECFCFRLFRISTFEFRILIYLLRR